MEHWHVSLLGCLAGAHHALANEGFSQPQAVVTLPGPSP
jgi:hypothetical protein